MYSGPRQAWGQASFCPCGSRRLSGLGLLRELELALLMLPLWKQQSSHDTMLAIFWLTRNKVFFQIVIS